MSPQAYVLILKNGIIRNLKLNQNNSLFISSKTSREHPKTEEACFLDIQVEDIVYFGEGEPTNAIIGKGIVLKGLNKTDHNAIKSSSEAGIQILFNTLIGPIPFEVINNLGIFKIGGLHNHFKKGLREDRLVKINNQQESQIDRLSDTREVAKEIKTLAINNLLDNMRNLIEICWEEDIRPQYRHLEYLRHEILMNTRGEELGPLHREDVRGILIKQGFFYIASLRSNHLTGNVLAKDGRVIVPVIIDPYIDDDQKQFEKDLKGLMKQILDLKTALGLKNITITFKFSPDAKLRLPKWFLSLCEENGIVIEMQGEEEEGEHLENFNGDVPL